MNVVYTTKAKRDLRLAFLWYEEQRAGLGMDFLDCIEVAIESIARMPEMYVKHHENFRRALIRRFPFSIFYTIEQATVVVHAIFDNRQNPARLP